MKHLLDCYFGMISPLLLFIFRFKFLSVLYNFFDIGLCPLCQLGNKRNQRAPHVRQLVFYFRRHYGIDFSGNECIGFQRLQRAGQNT